MKRAIAIAAVLCVSAVVAEAALTPVQTWDVAKDSAVFTASGFGKYSYGFKSSTRIAQNSFDGAWYGQWSDSDKEAIVAKLAEDPATYLVGATQWYLVLEVKTNYAVSPKPFAWKSGNAANPIDWTEGTAAGGSTNGSPNYSVGTPTDPTWKTVAGVNVDCLLDMRDFLGILYSALFTWDGSGVTGPADTAQMNSAALTNPASPSWSYVGLDGIGPGAGGIIAGGLVDWLLNDPDCQGLMFNEVGSGTIWTDDSATVPRLALYAPEPATLVLLGLGGALLIRRRRR